MLNPSLFFDLEGLNFASLFDDDRNVWEVLPAIKNYINDRIQPNVSAVRAAGEVLSRTHVLWQGQVLTENLDLQPGDAAKGAFKVFHNGEELSGATVLYAGAALMDDRIELGAGVVVEPGALIKGPTIIGKNSEVRQGAYLRGSCLVGRRCIVGHVTEMKNAVMLDDAKAGHFAYLGDSILGRNVNLGAGTKLANLKIVSRPIKIRTDGDTYTVDFRKFGAILGDDVETGCNSVTSPGVVMGKRCLVAPCITVPGGYHPAKSVIRGPKLVR